MNENYVPDNSSFYYLAGLCIGRYYGTDAPLEFRQKVVNKFKEWVDLKNGSDPLPTDERTINQIAQKFLFEFERYERKQSRGRQRH